MSITRTNMPARLWMVAAVSLALVGGLLVRATPAHAQIPRANGNSLQGHTPQLQSLVFPTGTPKARRDPGMAYDAARGQVVMFGGDTGNQSRPFRDTWTWNGTSWTKQSPANSPPRRLGMGMTYDAAIGKVVLFGGYDRSIPDYVNDTWTWDGTNWTRESPASSPPGRIAMGLAYDEARGKVVLFGGFGTNAFFNDTWTWDGTNWTQEFPASVPRLRSNAGMTYDAMRGKVVLFGGWSRPSLIKDTWTWDGTNWTQEAPAANPRARQSFNMTYDPAVGKVVLFGGIDKSGGTLHDTWTWNGTTWTKKQPSHRPPGRSGEGMAYDGTTAQVLIFGGSDSQYFADTWTWDGTDWNGPRRGQLG